MLTFMLPILLCCPASTSAQLIAPQLDPAVGESSALSADDWASISAVQEAYIKASNSNPCDLFGSAVAISGDTVVVGASGESSPASGVNGNNNENSAGDSGAAYVFVRSGEGLVLQAYIKASNTDGSDQFGSSLALSGNTLVIGAPFEDSGASGVAADQSDNSATSAGAAYVFVRNGGSWAQQAYLKASNAGTSDNFGWRVAVSGDTLVVGAPNEDSGSVGVNGKQGDNSVKQSGAAYVFVRDGTRWHQQAYLKASNTDIADRFGWSLAVDGDTVLVSGPLEDSRTTGVDGDQGDNSAIDSGAVYAFVRRGTSWSQEAFLKASNADTGDGFGGALSLSQNTAVIGATDEDCSASGVNGDQGGSGASNSGAAYVFVRSGSSWSQQAYLKASNPNQDDAFGWAVALSDDTLVVGARAEASRSTGVDGDQNDNSAPMAGAAYVFVRSGVNWRQRSYLKASNTGAGDFFSGAVNVSADTVVIGAISEDSAARGVHGNQANNAAEFAGAAYIFDLNPSGWFEMGLSLPGSAGIPRLEGEGELRAGSENRLLLSHAAAEATAVLFASSIDNSTLFQGGTLRPAEPLFAPLLLSTSPSGARVLAFSLPADLPPGSELWFQMAIADGGAPRGLALSNALLAICP